MSPVTFDHRALRDAIRAACGLRPDEPASVRILLWDDDTLAVEVQSTDLATGEQRVWEAVRAVSKRRAGAPPDWHYDTVEAALAALRVCTPTSDADGARRRRR